MKRRNRNKSLVAVGAVVSMLVSGVAYADPCGMVPPIPPVRVMNVNQIERVGAQKTYVAHGDGIETMVLRPGFKGKVDEFGMLIPFPTSPAIRKVDDDIFAHIAAAIDPPEVVAHVQRWQRRRGLGFPSAAKRSAAPEAEADQKLAYDTVKVVKREAVGMYDVAVLAAGSAKALNRWMDSQGFQYPKGMDKVVNEYVDINWVFVAVKTKVGQKAGVNPTPGMKSVNPNLPSGATFTGNVQAMGFRFKSEKLVVPMRLSAFNPGELRNITYILSETGRRIDSIPKRYVVRQLSGKELHDNVTKPLPLRVFNGTIRELTSNQRQQVKIQRNPEPHNGLAKDLFASDMLAMQKNRLANPYEEEEKELLAIGEALGLRGKQIDALHRDVLKRKRSRATDRALSQMRRMTLTVVDGEFEREVIARENLTFSTYKMNPARNNSDAYNARMAGPGPANQGGKLYRSELTVPANDPKKANPFKMLWGLALFGLGGILIYRRRDGVKKATKVLTVAIVAGGMLVATNPAEARKVVSTEALIQQLGNEDTRSNAHSALVARGSGAVDELLDEVFDGGKTSTRGWAVVVLTEIGGDDVNKGLAEAHASAAIPMLVRTWAAAGRVQMAGSMQELTGLAGLANQFPAVQRPLGKKIQSLALSVKGPGQAEALLLAAQQFPQLNAQLQPVIQGLSADDLIGAMITGSNNTVRQWAASYTAQKIQSDPAALNVVLDALRFNKKAKNVPWNGGALFLPGMNLNQSQARELADNLIRWHVYCDKAGDQNNKRIVHNNLNQPQLASRAGYARQPGNASTEQWLVAWGKVQGKQHIWWMLRQQKVEREARYRAVLDQL